MLTMYFLVLSVDSTGILSVLFVMQTDDENKGC